MVWLQDGTVVYDSSETYTKGAVCNYWTMRFDLKTGRRRGGPTRLTNWPDVCMNWPDVCITSSVTKDERRFARSSDFVTTYIADINSQRRRLTNYRHFTHEDATQFVGHWTRDRKSAYVFDYPNHFPMLNKRLERPYLWSCISVRVQKGGAIRHRYWTMPARLVR